MQCRKIKISCSPPSPKQRYSVNVKQNRWQDYQLSIVLYVFAGYRETAFAYAISAAGVAHNVARACSMGRLLSCGCDPSNYKGKTPAKARGVQWKWGGCSHNLDYGMEFSRQFLDTREKAGDIQSTVNLHNNRAGRLVSATFATLSCLNSGYERVPLNSGYLSVYASSRENTQKA